MPWQWPLLAVIPLLIGWNGPANAPGSAAWITLALIVFGGLGFWGSVDPAATRDYFLMALLLWCLAQSFSQKASRLALVVFHPIAALFALFALTLPLERIHAFFPNQNLLSGAVFAPALILAWGDILDKKGAWRAYAVAGLCAAGIFATGSRGGLLALAAGALWIIYRYRQRAWIGLLCLVIFVAGMFFIPGSALSQRLAKQKSVSSADAHFDFRLNIWKASIKAANERWLRGWGLGSYERVMEDRELELPAGEERLRLEHAHNSWIELALETGWPVTLALAGLTLMLFWNWSREAPGQSASYEAALAALLAHSLVDFEYSTPWCLFLGVLFLRAREAGRENWPVPTANWRWAMALASALLLSSSVALWRDRGLRGKELPCGSQDYRILAWMRPLDVSLTARQAVADTYCFDVAKDSRGLFRELRELAVTSDIDPWHQGLRRLFSALLLHAADSLSDQELNSLGPLMPFWNSTSIAFPKKTASEKFKWISLEYARSPLNVQAK